jgi:hypothetical protein
MHDYQDELEENNMTVSCENKSPCKNDNGDCDDEDYNNKITNHDGDFDQDWGDNYVESRKENTDPDEMLKFLRGNELT